MTKTVTMASRLLLAGCLLLQIPARAQSALDARQFKKHWRVESESADARLSFSGDTCEIRAPKGLTLWRKEKLTAGVAVEYDVQVIDRGRDGDRLSDMNAFWLASDPETGDVWKRLEWRNGVFTRCYTLQMYYLGYGGNHNTTTRFRRYTGDALGVADTTHRPAILKEYTDAAHLLRPNHWYHVRIETLGGRTSMYVDGERIVSYLDPEPLTSGWFGFRTTLSHTRITNFRILKLSQPSLATGIPLHWVTSLPENEPGARKSLPVPQVFGIPFAPGELYDVTRLGLSAGVAADAWINARWPDGSVKWAGMAAVLPPGSDCRVTENTMKPAKTAPMVNQTQEELVVATGAMTAFIPKHGPSIIDSIITANGRKTVTQGLLLANSGIGKVTEARIERSGSVMTVVRLEGKHAESDRTWLPFVVRLYFFRGSRQIKLVHTFFYDGNEQCDAIASLGVSFGVPLSEELYNRHVAFATDGGGVWEEPVKPLSGRRRLSIPPTEKDRSIIDKLAAWDGYRLSQLTDNAFSIRKRATSRSPWTGTFTAGRAPGYACVGDSAGGLAVCLKDFWQSYPSTIQVDHARSDEARLTVWLWSPEAEPMNLCHYDTIAHGLDASYEDVQPGMSSPYGIARTSTLWLEPLPCYAGREAIAAAARRFEDDARLLPTPEYLHAKRAFGLWSLPTDTAGSVERRLKQYLDFYRNAVEQHKWYGFWNYGDFMHAYSPERHSWLYDVGGYAWDNTELASPMWLWYSFLRTGRHDVLRMAEAMTRHNAEVDTYHLGPFAPLGSRHNVTHWGCGAKEARISQSAFLRFHYYLTCDDRTGEVMHAQTDADTLLYHLDPMRLAEPRSQFPSSAPARLRIGPDWMAYAGNWMTEWERTGNNSYRDKILTGLQSIATLPHGLFTGNKALGYHPATGLITYEGPDRQNTNHLMTIMGGFEVMNELLPTLATLPAKPTGHGLQPPAVVTAFRNAWLTHALQYKQKARNISNNHFAVRRLLAYAAWQTRNPRLAAEAWHDLWHRIEHTEAPRFNITTVQPPAVPAPIDEWQGLSTNDAALWSLDAIFMQEVLP